MQEEVFLCTQASDRVAIGLIQPQLGDYDSYIHDHGRLVGHGNVRVLIQTYLVITLLLYTINGEINTTMDAVVTFVIWPEYLLVPVNVLVVYLST